MGSIITVDGDCSHEIKKFLVLGKKAMANLDSILKGRAIILLTEVLIVKTIIFPAVLYGCTKLCVYSDSETPQEIEPDLPFSV